METLSTRRATGLLDNAGKLGSQNDVKKCSDMWELLERTDWEKNQQRGRERERERERYV